MKYLMVTSWDDHWNKIPSTYYTKRMFRGRMREELIEENTETIFIKINRETKILEKAWIGKVNNFKITDDKIYFDVIIDKEIPIPSEHKDKTEGWYIIEKQIVTKIPQEVILYPPFFFALQETKDWTHFEDYVYFLLKLIGINNIYKYEKQKGLPDGFFKLKRLAVLYDCTLERDFMKSKEQQIKNFCSQFSEGCIKIGRNEIPIGDCFKEVWIITKGQSNIKQKIGEVTVKEVSIFSLLEVYHFRLEKINNEEELEEKLKEIGK